MNRKFIRKRKMFGFKQFVLELSMELEGRNRRRGILARECEVEVFTRYDFGSRGDICCKEKRSKFRTLCILKRQIPLQIMPTLPSELKKNSQEKEKMANTFQVRRRNRKEKKF